MKKTTIHPPNTYALAVSTVYCANMTVIFYHLTYSKVSKMLTQATGGVRAGEIYCRCSHHLNAYTGKSPKNLLHSFEGFDLLDRLTKCFRAHELLDLDLSGSVVKNVTEREERELIAL